MSDTSYTQQFGGSQNLSVPGVETQLKLANQQMGLLIQTLKAIFPVTGATSTTATGGTHAVPANALLFLDVTLPDGTQGKVAVFSP